MIVLDVGGQTGPDLRVVGSPEGPSRLLIAVVEENLRGCPPPSFQRVQKACPEGTTGIGGASKHLTKSLGPGILIRSESLPYTLCVPPNVSGP